MIDATLAPTNDREPIRSEIITPDDIQTKITEVNAEMAALGLVKLEDMFVKRVRAIGLGSEVLGAATLAQGFCVATQTQVFTTMQTLGELLKKHSGDAEMSRGIAYAIGYLADKMTRATKATVELVGENRMAHEQQDQSRSRTFRPGEVVGAATRITVENVMVAKEAAS